MLSLVSITSTVYPSLIETWPPSLLVLSKHMDVHTCAHIFRTAYVQTHAVELWKHLEELIQCTDNHFLEGTKRTIREAWNSLPLLTQTSTHTDTRTDAHTPQSCWGRGHQMSRENKTVSLLSATAVLNFPRTRPLFFLSTQSIICKSSYICFPVKISGPPGQREVQESFLKNDLSLFRSGCGLWWALQHSGEEDPASSMWMCDTSSCSSYITTNTLLYCLNPGNHQETFESKATIILFSCANCANVYEAVALLDCDPFFFCTLFGIFLVPQRLCHFNKS